MENELKEQAGDFITASSIGRLEELEGTVTSQATRIWELEQWTKERDFEMARLTLQQQAPPMTGPSTEVVKLRRQLASVQAVRLALSYLHFFVFACI